MSDFKVGDKVRIIAIPDSGHSVGDIGTVTYIGSGLHPYTVEVNDRTGYYKAREIEAIDALPAVPAPGMSSADLALYVGNFIRAAKARVNGVGNDQYATPEGQKFETMTVPELIQMGREEAQDLAVYAAMIDIRLARLAEALTTVKGAL